MHLLAATTGGDPHAWLTYLEGILICVATGSGLRTRADAALVRFSTWFGSKTAQQRVNVVIA